MRRFILSALAVSAVVAGVIAYYGSPRPDGLERADEILSRSEEAATPAALPSPMPDYAVPGMGNTRLAVGLAGVIGVAITFGLCLIVGRLVSRRSETAQKDTE